MPQWRAHVELQTSSLADDVQLTVLTAQLRADAALSDVSPSAASLGSRYSLTATVTLSADDAQAAQDLATSALQTACASAGILAGNVLARGLVPNL